jgi:hypothetical protein
VRTLGRGKGLEPICSFREPLFTGPTGHSGIHVGIFVGLDRYGGGEVLLRVSNR